MWPTMVLDGVYVIGWWGMGYQYWILAVSKVFLAWIRIFTQRGSELLCFRMKHGSTVFFKLQVSCCNLNFVFDKKILGNK